jgi:hypothetical protein
LCIWNHQIWSAYASDSALASAHARQFGRTSFGRAPQAEHLRLGRGVSASASTRAAAAYVVLYIYCARDKPRTKSDQQRPASGNGIACREQRQ